MLCIKSPQYREAALAAGYLDDVVSILGVSARAAQGTTLWPLSYLSALQTKVINQDPVAQRKTQGLCLYGTQALHCSDTTLVLSWYVRTPSSPFRPWPFFSTRFTFPPISPTSKTSVGLGSSPTFSAPASAAQWRETAAAAAAERWWRPCVWSHPTPKCNRS